MNIEEFVMAYEVEQDRIRALLPEGFESIRPVLRINAHKINGKNAYIEFNTPVAYDGKRGWLNIANWCNEPEKLNIPKWKNCRKEKISVETIDMTTVFTLPFLKISFKNVGIEGGCPAEKDNDGCFFIGEEIVLKPPYKYVNNKHFCNCKFEWNFSGNNAKGESMGKTLPAYFTEPVKIYDKQVLTAENTAMITCKQVLGAYEVEL